MILMIDNYDYAPPGATEFHSAYVMR